MRKRAQRKSIPTETIEKTTQKIQKSNKIPQLNKNMLIAISLVAIFLMVLFLNSYFNIASGETYNAEGDGLSQYYLSGPDPYYNMRLVEETMYGENAGTYPFYSDDDPLLNYPIGRSGGRRPLMNMMAIMTSQFMLPFMDEVDALGIAMQFIPALFGALLVFPVYFIGETLFNRKIGLLSAFFIALIPIHLGSGHGSAFSLFDHDSFNLFMITCTYLFLIKAIKEKDSMKSMLYAFLGGMPLAGLSMVWVEAQFLYAFIAVYAVAQMLIDIYTNKIDIKVPRTICIILFTGYILSLPILLSKGIALNLEFYICIGMALFGIVYLMIKRLNIPWTLSLPFLFIVAAGGIIFLIFVPTLSETFPILKGLTKLSQIILGSGIYGKKVAATIAEAGTYDISRTVMSFGPALFWLSWIGFFLIGVNYLRKEHRRDHLFMLVFFIIQIWFLGVAGRFINDLVVPVALLSAWFVWYVVDRIDYGTMVRSIRAAGGGIHGIRRGVKFLHVSGILFVAFIVVLPNAYLSLDAAVPGTQKADIFGDLPNGAFGGGIGKETYWVDAYEWFAQQDTEIANPIDRPAYISWWDYGFYEVAVGEHPTVADNFQDGIPPAANFHTATSEQEAVTVWIVRLLEGNSKANNDQLTPDTKAVLNTYLNESDATNIIQWVQTPTSSPSYGELIAEPKTDEVEKLYTIGEQWPENAVYHDVVEALKDYDDEIITMLYRDIQEATGKSIRYYGVEIYDRSIFNIFGFLSDKSLLLLAGGFDYDPEDEFKEVKYVSQSGQQLTYDEIVARSDTQNREDPIIRTTELYKDPYFQSMFYRTFVGINQTDENGQTTEPQYQLPCFEMKHFYGQYISPYPEYAVEQGKSAVVIAKYYEGAVINGTITYNGELQDFQVVVQQNITHYGTEVPVDHDKAMAVNGTYQVVVPAGVSTFQIQRYPELGVNAFSVATVTFDNPDENSNLATITEAEATRQGEYHRTVDIAIDSGSLSGYVYDDLDNKEGYNESIDQSIEDIKVSLYTILSLDVDTGQPQEYDFDKTKQMTTGADGFYNFTDLLPGYYQVVAENSEGFQIDNILIPVAPEENTYDITLPEPGAVDGTIYYDTNANGQYDQGEEMNGVNVDLVYSLTNTVADTLTTEADGHYSFDNIIPGGYRLDLSKLPEYESSTTLEITQNQTLTNNNVSIQFAPVTVSGETKDISTATAVSNITVTFTPDASFEGNTAIRGQVKSDETGTYSVELIPGNYNVSITSEPTADNVTYTHTSKLALTPGMGSATKEILMTRTQG